ncbi:MAG: acetyl-CoA carboxylase carboxyl transferase subunit alpha/beta [Desulfovibrio sp.]|jgi:acetyl-CoA carboxylase carboxyl transferase subunit beta|nr:acetyl-CoA carboxylase carboxyl transferase subunit alpha/beta [Desulfovibrio sp.]
METEKQVQRLNERLTYIRDIFAGKDSGHIRLLDAKTADYAQRAPGLNARERRALALALEDLFADVENKLEADLTPMDKVRIVRHPQRFCLRDILENVYDGYTEIGSMDDHSIDPAMVIARGFITRRRGKRVTNQSVMIVGHEKGRGEEFRNGGSAKPWGNAKALHYMKVAETENIPVHAYVFTPGSYPIEDTPGAAQQIAANIYGMASLRVPVIAVISEGGSGGAEAVALADRRLMFSHGYYSVISPEGAAAIEGKPGPGGRVPAELVEQCALRMKITAEDNLRMGYVDQIIPEPDLGARPYHYDFFRGLRRELLRVTDEVSISVRGLPLFRALRLRGRRRSAAAGRDFESSYVRWNLPPSAQMRLVSRRHLKFRGLSLSAALDRTPLSRRIASVWQEACWIIYSRFRHDMLQKRRQKVSEYMEEVKSDWTLFFERALTPLRKLAAWFGRASERMSVETVRTLTELSEWNDTQENQRGGRWAYISAGAGEDRAVSCPNAGIHGCLDQWAPDLYGEFAGVCPNCGHHFPMEYQWYLHNVFDAGSLVEFAADVEAGNPLGMEDFGAKLEASRKRTGHKSACMVFEARIKGVRLVVAMLMADFRGGTVGAAEGEKFIRAAERAGRMRFPFFAYVHGTAGIRIQEGTNGLIQMPRCTMAVRRYIDAGGLYIVCYDTNSYAGPVASFLGCSPYQFGIRSANVGFAGPAVIAETTGLPVPPHYHNVYKALARGHIQGIWDRRELRFNLSRALLTMGGRNLYYR